MLYRLPVIYSVYSCGCRSRIASDSTIKLPSSTRHARELALDSGELNWASLSKMRGEVIPLAVEENAAQVEHMLGAASAPSHPRTIEPHTDEVADSAFARTGADLEIATAEFVVGHAVATCPRRGDPSAGLLALPPWVRLLALPPCARPLPLPLQRIDGAL